MKRERERERDSVSTILSEQVIYSAVPGTISLSQLPRTETESESERETERENHKKSQSLPLTPALAQQPPPRSVPQEEGAANTPRISQAS